MKNYLALTIFVLFFASCDEENYVSYIIDNKTSDSLKLEFKYSEDYFGIETGDTVMFLGGNSEKVLFVHTVISPRVYNPETEEKMIYIAYFDIIRIKDSLKVLKDVTLRKNWDYIEKGNHAAKLSFTVYDSDF